MFNFKFTVMEISDLQNKPFRFKISFKTFENFKTTLGYYLSNFCILISFQANIPFFMPEYRSIEGKIGLFFL